MAKATVVKKRTAKTSVVKKVKIAGPIEKVWAALTDRKAIGAWMGDANTVKVGLKVGGKYKFFGGETTGTFTRIEQPNRLEYTWRQSSWQKSWPDSIVAWELKAMKSGTQVHLTHSQFPNVEERDGHDEGWDLYWLAPMKAWLEAGRS